MDILLPVVVGVVVVVTVVVVVVVVAAVVVVGCSTMRKILTQITQHNSKVITGNKTY